MKCANRRRFPFPLTGTYVQLILTHMLLIAFSSLTRGLASPLRRLGFGAAVAPAIPVAPQGGAFRSTYKVSAIGRFLRWLSNGSGGIAGGGLFEFEYNTAKQVLPLAIVFVFKVLLSNFSFAYDLSSPAWLLPSSDLQTNNIQLRAPPRLSTSPHRRNAPLHPVLVPPSKRLHFRLHPLRRSHRNAKPALRDPPL